MIEPGRYKARAVDAEFGTSSQKQTPFCRIRFEVQTPAGKEVVPWTGWFTNTVGQDGRTPTDRAFEAMRFAGCTFPNDDATDTTGLGSREVEVDVEHEEYQTRTGEVRYAAKVAWVNEIGASGKVREEDRMDQNAKAAFAAQMKGHLRAQRAGAPRPKRAAPAPTSAVDEVVASVVNSDDDIPF